MTSKEVLHDSLLKLSEHNHAYMPEVLAQIELTRNTILFLDGEDMDKILGIGGMLKKQKKLKDEIKRLESYLIKLKTTQ